MILIKCSCATRINGIWFLCEEMSVFHSRCKLGKSKLDGPKTRVVEEL
jgi:hypothetical protein